VAALTDQTIERLRIKAKLFLCGGSGKMNAEALVLFLDEANRLESRLVSLLGEINGSVESSTYEEIEEQVRQVREAVRNLKVLLVNVEVTVQ